MGICFEEKKIKMVSNMLRLMLLLVAIATGAYVPPTSTEAQLKFMVPKCPVNCYCMSDPKVMDCTANNLDLTFLASLPWKLKRLRLYSDNASRKKYSSLRQLLNQGIFQPAEASLIYSELVQLDISYVSINQVTLGDLDPVPNLIDLKLTYNNISSIQPGAFNSLYKLQVLDLSGNQLQSLAVNSLSGLKHLKTLYLSSNRLSIVTSEMFNGLDELEILHLSNNNLLQIETLMENLTHLNVLNVRRNRINYILNGTVEKLDLFENVLISGNPFQCSCAIAALVSTLQSESGIEKDQVTCAGPIELIGHQLSDLSVETLPCEVPDILAVSPSTQVLNRAGTIQKCKAVGTAPLVVYWLTPWGEKYIHPSMVDAFPKHLSGSKYDEKFSGLNLDVESRVFITEDGSLHIEKFRGIFAGTFTCVSLNLMGQVNETVEVGVYNKMPTMYITSLYIGGICCGSMLLLAIIIGSVRLFVNKCLHSEGCNCCCCNCEDDYFYDIKKAQTYTIEEVEVVYATSDDASRDMKDFDPDAPPPGPPVNSPTVRSSPDKCLTPEETTVPTNISPHIWEQLDEVRSRLRYGAERKIEKVRSHVKTITDTGSLKIRNIKDAGNMKIQSIKETGSHAASKMKKNVAGGMLQVKYGVQSIKEFCGTGEMGPGTVSMVSVTTDVDKNEQVHMVKSHTFV